MPREIPKQFLNLVSRLHEVCRKTRTRYALIGGVAMRAYGAQRETMDADIALGCAPDRIDAFLAKAERSGFKLDPPHKREPFKHQLVRLWWDEGERTIKVDVQVASLEHMQQAVDGRRRLKIGRRAFWFARPEDVIVLKLIAARDVDMKDVAHLLALPRDELDRAYLRETIAKWQMQKLLGEAESLVRDGERPGAWGFDGRRR